MNRDLSGAHVLISSLNWGLGHASRSVAIARKLSGMGAKVSFASDGVALDLYRRDFPDAEHYELPSYQITYAAKGDKFLSHIMALIPKMYKAIQAENKVVDQLVKEKRITHIISDSRMGIRNKNTLNAIVNHHLKVPFPKGWGWAELVYEFVMRHYLNKFDQIWIPDFPDRKLSGVLSELQLQDSYFIGPLSRMRAKVPAAGTEKYQLLAVISGPEPQRTFFEEILTEQLKSYPHNCMLVCGQASQDYDIQVTPNFRKKAFLNSNEMEAAWNESKMILSRSGYTTIMELASSGHPAILVPTPGQTEQVYLAEMLNEKGFYYTMDQENFNLSKALSESHKFPGLQTQISDDLLESVLLPFMDMRR